MCRMAYVVPLVRPYIDEPSSFHAITALLKHARFPDHERSRMDKHPEISDSPTCGVNSQPTHQFIHICAHRTLVQQRMHQSSTGRTHCGTYTTLRQVYTAATTDAPCHKHPLWTAYLVPCAKSLTGNPHHVNTANLVTITLQV